MSPRGSRRLGDGTSFQLLSEFIETGFQVGKLEFALMKELLLE